MNAITKQQSTALAQVNEQELMQVLRTSLYPGASDASIKLVMGYCKAAGLDPIQKPVHIVPMWDRNAGAMRDVIMPGVNLYRTNAARTDECAGVTEPEFGPDVDAVLGNVNVTFPAWCKVTVSRRLPTGEIAHYTAKEFWKENYAVKGGKEQSIAPNAMWLKRPYGQLAKCAEAQALRKAFPEHCGAPTAEEMEGKAFDATGADAPPEPVVVPADLLADARESADKGAEAFRAFWKELDKSKREALKPELSALQEAAEKADSNTVEMPNE